MLNLLNSIVSVIKQIVMFVVHSFETLLSLFTTIPKFVIYVVTLTRAIVPDVLIPFIIASILISVVYFLINRKSGAE